MKTKEYEMGLRAQTALVGVLLDLPLGEMWEAQKRAEAIGPTLDPSLFMANGEKLRQDGAITTALLGAQRAILRAMKSAEEGR